MTNHPLTQDSVWLNQSKFEDAERVYQEALAGTGGAQRGGSGGVDGAVLDRLSLLEKENKDLKKVTQDLRNLVLKLEGRVVSLEKGAGVVSGSTTTTTSKPAADDDDDEDDDFDPFADDPDMDEAAEKLKQERLQEYAEKKKKKGPLVAKSNLVLDVKPWDDETDMAELEKHVRSIKMDGLLWGNSKLVPVGYGIKKLQITCVIEDDKVSTDDLEEQITAFDDVIQSMDIAAFNKI
ncbi:elongation factor 1-delta-like isoform X2 [Liolophura sinensis]|uniref:elongation factor 1-delta-like isoform X2 n=1 Tax=Liolophura sinensis TaxID=3198878 RepID=UPI003158012E